jgi:hypothetical protein
MLLFLSIGAREDLMRVISGGRIFIQAPSGVARRAMAVDVRAWWILEAEWVTVTSRA